MRLLGFRPFCESHELINVFFQAFRRILDNVVSYFNFGVDEKLHLGDCLIVFVVIVAVSFLRCDIIFILFDSTVSFFLFDELVVDEFQVAKSCDNVFFVVGAGFVLELVVVDAEDLEVVFELL